MTQSFVFNPFTENLDIIDSTVPAGSEGNIQFNQGGNFGANSGLTWNNGSGRLGIGTITPGATLDVSGITYLQTPITMYNTSSARARGIIIEDIASDGRTRMRMDDNTTVSDITFWHGNSPIQLNNVAAAGITLNSLVRSPAAGAGAANTTALLGSMTGTGDGQTAILQTAIHSPTVSGTTPRLQFGARDFEFQTIADNSTNWNTIGGSATTRMVITFSGLMGVGIGSPTAQLHISGMSYSRAFNVDVSGVPFALSIISGGFVNIGSSTSTGQLVVNSNAAGTVPLVIRGSGAQTANLLVLQNSGATTLASIDANGDLSLHQGYTTINAGTGTQTVVKNNNAAAIRMQSNTGMSFEDSNGVAYFAPTPSKFAVLTNPILIAGDGDSNTGFKLQQDTSVSYRYLTLRHPNGGNEAGIKIFQTNDMANGAFTQLNNTATSTDLSSTKVGTGSTVSITFSIDTTEVARITTGSKFGVGTSTPNARFEVSGIGYSSSFTVHTSGLASALTVISGGNVGFGVSSPYAQVQISGNLLVSSGTQTLPGFSIGSSNTGIYVAGDQMAFTQNGVLKAYFDDSNRFYLNAINLMNGGNTITINGDGGAAQQVVITAANNNLGIQTATPNSTLHLNGGYTIKRNLKTANYTLTGSDYLIGVGSRSGAITLTLPATSNTGSAQIFIFKDEGGVASVGSIVIAGSGNELIDGGSRYTMNTNYQSITTYNAGTAWYII